MISLRERMSLLQKAFGKCVLANDGVNASLRCVNHNCNSRLNHTKLKLVIKLDEELYHCWVCGLKGRKILTLFRKYAPSYFDQAKEIFSYDNITQKQIDIIKEEVKLPKGFLLLASNLDSKHPDVKAVLKYLKTRDITIQDMWYYRLGTTTFGRTRRRVIFPSLNLDGDVNYWVARIIDEGKTYKYCNSKATKKTIIFNEINIDFTKRLTIVEGPFDLVKCDENAICLLGSDLNEKYSLFRECAKHRTPILLALDADMPIKIQKISKALHMAGCNIKIMPLGKFSDVGEMSKEQFIEQKRLAYNWDPIDQLYQKISGIKNGTIL